MGVAATHHHPQPTGEQRAAANSKVAHSVSTSQQHAELDNAADADADDDDFGIVQDMTDFEDDDADPSILGEMHIRLGRIRECRQKRLANEQKRFELQAQEVAAQQAKLVELQATADTTTSEIAALQRKYAATFVESAQSASSPREPRWIPV